MNKEELENRLKSIEEAILKQNTMINQALADLNAMIGSKQEVLHWISQLDVKDKHDEHQQ